MRDLFGKELEVGDIISFTSPTAIIQFGIVDGYSVSSEYIYVTQLNHKLGTNVFTLGRSDFIVRADEQIIKLDKTTLVVRAKPAKSFCPSALADSEPCLEESCCGV